MKKWHMEYHTAKVTWSRGTQAFIDNRFSRKHLWRFDGGIEVVASASPHVVPPPLSVREAVDPEEAFIASLSSCHMLWFLAIAARKGFVVDEYADAAEGFMEKNSRGKMAMSRVVLRPKVQFSGPRVPGTAEIASMHHAAHEECFIANSVTSEVVCEPAS